MKHTPLSHRVIAEAIGTGAIVFFGCGAIMVFLRVPGALSVSASPVIFGLVVAAMIYAFGHISGAHFNPAVTLAFAIARHFPFREVITYWLGQFAGALLSVGLLALLFPSSTASTSFGATLPHVTIMQALLWEFLLTYTLMVVIMAVATDTRAVGIMAGAAIGAVVMIDAFVGGWATGASMNPARSLAPAIAEGSLSTVWIYFIAPMLGAIAGAVSYKLLAGGRRGEKEPHDWTPESGKAKERFR